MLEVDIKSNNLKDALLRQAEHIVYEYDEAIKIRRKYLICSYLKVILFCLIVFPIMLLAKNNINNWLLTSFFIYALLVLFISMYFRDELHILKNNQVDFKECFLPIDSCENNTNILRILGAEDKNYIISNLQTYDNLINFCQCVISINRLDIDNGISYFRYHDKWLRLDTEVKSELLYGVYYIFDENIEIPRLFFKPTGDIVFISNRKVL